MGGGGLYGTASDYLAFARMFLNDGRANGAQVLRPDTVAMMSRNQIGDLNVRDRLQMALDACREIAFHDLHVIDVVLEEQVAGADFADDVQRLE